MRYLLFSSCLFLLGGCASSYQQLQRVEGDVFCIKKFQPQFSSSVYSTQVNIVGNYLSGLLVIKKMPDSSIRVVFTSEMGLSLFDFEFGANNAFKVHYIIRKMNRKAVIKTLRKDFDLILMRGLDMNRGNIFRDNNRIYYSFPQEKGSNYYITDPECRDLLGMERASRKKAVVRAVMKDYNNGIPDTIGITHTNFQFTIGLKRLER